MQLAAARVAVNDQRALARACACGREVAGDERFAVTATGARNGQDQRILTLYGMQDVEPYLTERLDCLRRGTRGSIGAGLHMRQCAEDRQTQLTRDLIGIANATVEAVEQNREYDTERESA